MAKELDKKGRVSYGTVVRELMRSIGDYRAVTIATPLLVLVEVACEMAIPFLTAGLIDQIKVGATVAELLQPAAVLVLLALLSLAFGTGAGITCSHASCGFAKNLRRDMFYNIQRFSFANIDEFSSSSLVTRLTTDINNVQQAFMMIVRIAVRTPLCLVFAFTMAAVMGGALALVYAAIIPVLGFILFYIIHLVRPIFTRVFHKYDALNESIEENVTGMRVVKSYVREDYEKGKFAHAAQDICVDFTRAEKLLAFNNPVMMFAVDLTWVVIIYFGSQVIITSHGTLFDVGQLSAIFTYGFQILMSLMHAVHDLRHGHDGRRVCPPHQRGARSRAHDQRARAARHRGRRRLHRLRPRELQVLRARRAPGARRRRPARQKRRDHRHHRRHGLL